jgi:uncharacterized coiled-coil protein SlyX
MGLLNRIRMPKRGAALAALVGFALAIALPSVTIGVQRNEVELYRWLDRHGVVRYTTDLSRIPDSRRSTVVRVVPQSIPTATSSVAPPTAPLPGVVPAPDADPFNAPGQVPTANTQDLAPTATLGGSSWPELDDRIAELEILVARDEESIKEMVSTPQVGDHDELIDSEELREIGARLPVLQGELAELKRWRDDPDAR